MEDKAIQKATETIKDFKGVDILEGFEQVVEAIPSVPKDLKRKILKTAKDYHSKV